MSKKNLIIISCVILAIVLLFVLRTGGNKNIPPDATITAGASNTLGNEFITALLGVENITLDISLLNSPTFQSLRSSGAFVDSNPPKGKMDPFSANSGAENSNQQSVSQDQSSRAVNLGAGGTIQLPSDAGISISKITSSTAVVSLKGLPQGLVLNASVTSGSGNLFFISDFSYKDTGEYSTVLTDLEPKQNHVIQIESPTLYSSLSAVFDTK